MKKVCNVIISQESLQGARDYMEDFVSVKQLSKNRILMVVCDGHGGSRCAKYTCHAFCEHMSKYPDEDLETCLGQVSHSWDNMCLTRLKGDYPQTVEEREELFRKVPTSYYTDELHSGTTVVAVLLDLPNQRGHLLNLGDSRMLWKDYGVNRSRLKSTRDHKPDEKDLGPLGGKVTRQQNDNPRVNGDLAVGRAMGDNTRDLMGTIKHDADVKEFTWTGRNHFRVVLASDGVWDVLSNSTVMKMDTAEDVVQASLRAGSQDNVTCGMIDVHYEC